MASKAAKRAKRASHEKLLEHAKRHLEKGHPKLALKDAKASHRLRATAESRSFLEHVLIAQAQELYRYDRPACRAVLEELLKLGVTEPAVEAALPELLASFGLLDRLPGAERISSAERARLENRIADEAVLHAGESCVAGAALRAAAERIRSALASLEQGDEASALERLQGIGRESPLADWRFFVRGLAAYYRRDDEQMQDNWERLDPNRAAADRELVAAFLRSTPAGFGRRPIFHGARFAGGWVCCGGHLVAAHRTQRVPQRPVPRGSSHCPAFASPGAGPFPPGFMAAGERLRGGENHLDRAE